MPAVLPETFQEKVTDVLTSQTLVNSSDDFDEEMMECVTWLLCLRHDKEIGKVLQTTKALKGYHSSDDSSPCSSPSRNDQKKLNLGVRDTNKKRKRATRDEVSILRRAFAANPLPPQDLRFKIAQQLDWTPRKVKIWFQNERAKLRKRTRENLSVNEKNKEFPGLNDSENSQDEQETRKPSPASSTSLPILSTSSPLSSSSDGPQTPFFTQPTRPYPFSLGPLTYTATQVPFRQWPQAR
jgi:hypothetical protein